MTDKEYFDHPAWNHSAVKLLPNEPELFYGRHIAKVWPFEPTAEMDLGTILHGAVLLGEPLPIIPASALNGDGHRKGAQWKEWKDSHPGPALTEKEAEPLAAMLASVRGNAYAVKLLDAMGRTEEALFSTDATGLPLKGKVDKIAQFGVDSVLVDLKTTKDPSPDGFAKACATFAYHRQAAWYLDLAERNDIDAEAFLFIAVRNVAPYECVVYECSGEMIEQGRNENRAALDDLWRRLETNDWHSASHGKVNILDLPKWARREM